MRVFGDSNSGNCWKVRVVADHLRLAYDWVEVDVARGGARAPEILAVNPQGQVPAVDLGDGRALSQSNAIIRYLARGSDLIPADAFDAAKMDEWLFWEQYSHEPYIAVCRYQMVYEGRGAGGREAWRVARGERALDALQAHLARRDWLAGAAFSLADVALLAYTRLAGQGGFALEDRPAVMRWIARGERALGLEPVAA